ncbi:MAG: FAD:protein FMN transferase, partial [Acidimicrobiales bacterium]
MGGTHLEPVMGTVVGMSSPEPLPPAGLEAALEILHEIDRVFTTWDAGSPVSRLRAGTARLDELDESVLICGVVERCKLARELTGGAFDPWAMPGGFDPTGLVKGWAAARALDALCAAGATNVMV